MTHPDSIPVGTRPGSLHGMRVIELGISVAAPTAGQTLGDLGAEVIKIERVGHGDDTRGWAPPYWSGESLNFLALNRNKKSLELDFKTPEGAAAFEKLVASADVLLQNLRPGALAKAGFTWERLREINPRLVYCEMSGFGAAGPKAGDGAYDPLLQAYGGIVSLLPPDAEGSPIRVPLSILDRATGMWAVTGIMDALLTRERTGEGGLVQVSLLQSALSWVYVHLMGVRAGNEPPKNLGSGHTGVVPYGAFPTSDGHYVFISAGNQGLWERFCQATDATDLTERAEFETNPARVQHRAECNAAVSEVTARFTRADLVERLHAAKVPHAPVNHAHELPDDPQVQAVGMMQPLPHPNVEDLEIVATPITRDGAYLPHQCPPPLLGADTEAVLASLGYSDEQIAGLIASGAAGRTGVPVEEASATDDLDETAAVAEQTQDGVSA